MPKNNDAERERLALSIAASLPGEGGGYSMSTMFEAKNKKKLLGFWEVETHMAGETPFIDSFIARTLKGRTLESPSYSAVYCFKENVCIKKVIIAGMLEHPDGALEYRYVMNMALSWECELGGIRVCPEMGYQYTSLGGEPAAVKEMGLSGEWIKIGIAFESGTLVMTEGDDVKRLKAAL